MGVSEDIKGEGQARRGAVKWRQINKSLIRTEFFSLIQGFLLLLGRNFYSFRKLHDFVFMFLFQDSRLTYGLLPEDSESTADVGGPFCHLVLATRISFHPT